MALRRKAEGAADRSSSSHPSCRLLSNAFEELIAFQRALKDFVASVDATYAKQYEDFYIGLEGSFGSKHVSPRTLTACFLSCIVCVEGIVTKCETGGRTVGFGGGGSTCLLQSGWRPPGAIVILATQVKGTGCFREGLECWDGL